MICLATQRESHEVPRANRGFTMVETLLSLMILVIFTGIVAMGVPSAISAYTKAVDGSNAQVLLTTASSVLRDELGMAQDVDYNASTKEVQHYVTGAGHWASIDKTGSGKTARIQKHVYLGTLDSLSEATGSPTSIVSDATMTDSLGITYESITYDPGQGIFTVKGLEVLDASGNTIASVGDGTSDEFKIRQLR